MWATRKAMQLRLEHSQVMVISYGETVTLNDVWSLLPTQWVVDSVIHYVVKAMKTTVGLTDPSLAFFSSFFFTLLFQEGRLEEEGGGVFTYSAIDTWLSNLVPINQFRTLIFFKN